MKVSMGLGLFSAPHARCKGKVSNKNPQASPLARDIKTRVPGLNTRGKNCTRSLCAIAASLRRTGSSVECRVSSVEGGRRKTPKDQHPTSREAIKIQYKASQERLVCGNTGKASSPQPTPPEDSAFPTS